MPSQYHMVSMRLILPLAVVNISAHILGLRCADLLCLMIYMKAMCASWFILIQCINCFTNIHSLSNNVFLNMYAQMRTAKNSVSTEEYEKMRVFCHILSSQRITIERAFGMFLRKFGILWRPMEFGIEVNTTIVMVCAKLHNLSIDDWKKKGKQAGFIFANEERRCGRREARTRGTEQWEEDDVDLPTDEAVKEMMNNYMKAPTRACPNDSAKRGALKEEMYSHGLRHDVCLENDYVGISFEFV